MKNKKVLLLRTCGKWFEKLINWKVKYKFREVKPFWESRLLEKDWTPKDFDEIHIKNWYRQDSPLIIFKFNWNLWIFEHEWKPHFKLELWKIIDVLNYN